MKDLTLLEGERTDNKTGYKAEYPTEKDRVSLEFTHSLIHSHLHWWPRVRGRALTTTACWEDRGSGICCHLTGCPGPIELHQSACCGKSQSPFARMTSIIRALLVRVAGRAEVRDPSWLPQGSGVWQESQRPADPLCARPCLDFSCLVTR